MPPAAIVAIVQEEEIAIEAALAATVTATAGVIAPAVVVAAVAIATEAEIARAVDKHPSRRPGRSFFNSLASGNSDSPNADHARSNKQNSGPPHRTRLRGSGQTIVVDAVVNALKSPQVASMSGT